MRRNLIIICSIALLFLFIKGVNTKEEKIDSKKLKELIEYFPWYGILADSAGLSRGALYAAYESYLQLDKDQLVENDSVLTIIDYSKPSYEKRLYVIDIKNQKLLAQSLVAHGQNSGLVYAEKFSNKPNSHMSSLGMFLTANTYEGKHGYSLRLNGIEKGLNDNAYKRAIVVHGASYVNSKYIANNTRIGRSFGCPALPKENNAEIIDLIKNGSCFYIYHPSVIK